MVAHTEPDRGPMVSASEIARLAFCEHQIRLDVVRGRRTTDLQRTARQRGEQAHKEFYSESQRLAVRSERRGKCFVATTVLGDCPDTTALRQFRDLVLRRTLPGRRVIAAYYRVSPHICASLARRRILTAVLAVALKGLARVAAAIVARRLRREAAHGR